MQDITISDVLEVLADAGVETVFIGVFTDEEIGPLAATAAEDDASSNDDISDEDGDLHENVRLLVAANKEETLFNIIDPCGVYMRDDNGNERVGSYRDMAQVVADEGLILIDVDEDGDFAPVFWFVIGQPATSHRYPFIPETMQVVHGIDFWAPEDYDYFGEAYLSPALAEQQLATLKANFTAILDKG